MNRVVIKTLKAKKIKLLSMTARFK